MKLSVKKLIIIVIILIVFASIAYFILDYLKRNTIIEDNRYSVKDVEVMDDQLNDYLKNKIAPKGLATIYSHYKGNREVKDLYMGLYSFIDYLPSISKKLNKITDDAKLEKFFEKNQKDLKEKIGITKVEEFKEFVSYINDYDFNQLTFEYCEIDKESYEDTYSYLNMKISFKFEEREEPIDFIVGFSKRDTLKPVTIFSPVSDM